MNTELIQTVVSNVSPILAVAHAVAYLSLAALLLAFKDV